MRLPRLWQSLAAVAPHGADRARAVAVRRAIERASRSLPGCTCLVQSVAAARLLRAEGLPAELTIGVARGHAGVRSGLDAHAWVTSGDVVVAGDTDVTAYTALTHVGARR